VNGSFHSLIARTRRRKPRGGCAGTWEEKFALQHGNESHYFSWFTLSLYHSIQEQHSWNLPRIFPNYHAVLRVFKAANSRAWYLEGTFRTLICTRGHSDFPAADRHSAVGKSLERDEYVGFTISRYLEWPTFRVRIKSTFYSPVAGQALASGWLHGGDRHIVLISGY